MPLKNKIMQQILNTRQLRQAVSRGQHEFKVMLNGGIYSRKTIRLLADGRFRILNHIDETVQKLSGRQLHTKSIIGQAMKQGALIVSP
jgi:hypothetical protein